MIGLPSLRCDAAGRLGPRVNRFVFSVAIVLVAEISLSFVSNARCNLTLYMMQASYIVFVFVLFTLFVLVYFCCCVLVFALVSLSLHFVFTTQVL